MVIFNSYVSLPEGTLWQNSSQGTSPREKTYAGHVLKTPVFAVHLKTSQSVGDSDPHYTRLSLCVYIYTYIYTCIYIYMSLHLMSLKCNNIYKYKYHLYGERGFSERKKRYGQNGAPPCYQTMGPPWPTPTSRGRPVKKLLTGPLATKKCKYHTWYTT